MGGIEAFPCAADLVAQGGEGRGWFTINLHEVLLILEIRVILHRLWPNLSNWRDTENC